ncbi:MAG TPA: hypothetical protein VL966_14495 [Alphaproteobacteria bacterium]|jgi:hypothetical protein|nr:hypothetical protein [Alphaproteobacteria bacterium]
MLRWLAILAVLLTVTGNGFAQTIHPDLTLKLQIAEDDVLVLERMLETFADSERMPFYRRHAMGPLPDKRPTVRSYWIISRDDSWQIGASNLFSEEFFIFFYEKQKSRRSAELTRKLRESLERQWPEKVVPIDPRDIRLTAP